MNPFDPESTRSEASPSPDRPNWSAAAPTPPEPDAASFHVRLAAGQAPRAGGPGRRSRGGLLRAGIVAGSAVVLLASAIVTIGASPSPSGADPSAGDTASTAPSTAANGAGPWSGMGGMPGFGRGRGFGAGPGADFGFQNGRGPGFRAAVAGPITISAINGSSIGLKTDDGWTRTITVTSSTTITKGGQTISVGDLAVGDTVRLGQTRNSDGSYMVTAINVVVPTVAGTVSNLTASGFTLTARDNTAWTISLNGSTSYTLGDADASKSDLEAGQNVIVAGSQGTGNNLTALTVRIAVPHVVGQVTAKTGSTITITGRDGTTQVIHVTSATTYRIPGVTSPGLSDISVGQVIAAAGPQRSDGSIDATSVAAGRGKGLGGGKGFRGGPLAPGVSPSPSASGQTG